MIEDDDNDKPEEASDGFDHLDADHPSRDRSYGVGKNRPPVKNRFAKGVSGNPKGKKKDRHVANMIRDELLAPTAIRTPTGEKKVPAVIAQFLLLQQEALSGDKKARDQYFRIAQALLLSEPTPVEDEVVSEDDQAIIDDFISRRSSGSPSSTDPDKGEEDE